MRWKQFLTPVKSMTADKAKEYINDTPAENLTILDVRQPEEYKTGHLPGAKLIPLPSLPERLNEIDPEKSTVVYCAIGGRSRVAAQMLAGKGFNDIYNLSGGIKAWNGEKALLEEEKGLDLFTGNETPEETLIVAYSLEEGLGDFYVTMYEKVENEDAKKLFKQLSVIEVKHQERIFDEYKNISGKSVSLDEFKKDLLEGVVEGGMTTEEYFNLFMPNMESVADIIDLAMSIEAQALDLYMRASEKIRDTQSKEQLMQIANEEKAHLELLGKLIPKVL